MEIVIASSNLHKVREFREMLKNLKGFDILSLHNFPQYKPLEETGKTFKENAITKAVHAAQELGVLALADDSGLIVPILNGEPGVLSRRYAGENATDVENRQKLLKALQGRQNLERSAYFECSIALADPQGLKKCVTGRCEGVITTEERGRNGFGYDPIFMKHETQKTFSELDEAVKNKISHRGKAFEAISIVLESLRNSHAES
jgi:XTP/dITP diphosphohydrolase